MASGIKVTAFVLLLFGIVLGAVGSFIAVGDAWEQNDTSGVRNTEDYEVWSVTNTRTVDGDTVREDAKGWYNTDFDGTGGITYLRLAGPVLTLGLVFGLVAFLLVVTPGAGVRVGGVLGILGAITAGVAILLSFLGTASHAEAFLDGAEVTPGAGMFVLVATAVLLLVGGILATTVRTTTTDAGGVGAWNEHPAFRAGTSNTGGRALRCPDCGTLTTAPKGIVPTCTTCGFHRREAARAF